jgi:hypothetical protein
LVRCGELDRARQLVRRYLDDNRTSLLPPIPKIRELSEALGV